LLLLLLMMMMKMKMALMHGGRLSNAYSTKPATRRLGFIGCGKSPPQTYLNIKKIVVSSIEKSIT